MSELTTLQAVTAWLQQEPDQGALIADTDGLLIQDIIGAVSDEFEAQAGRVFGLQQHDELYDGHGTTQIPLRNWPVTSVATVEIDGRAIPSGSSTHAGWYHDGRRLLLSGYRFGRGAANVHAVYTAGFDPIPRNLARAATKMAATLFRERTHIGLSAQTMASQVTSYLNQDMPLDVQRVLASYQRVTPA